MYVRYLIVILVAVSLIFPSGIEAVQRDYMYCYRNKEECRNGSGDPGDGKSGMSCKELCLYKHPGFFSVCHWTHYVSSLINCPVWVCWCADFRPFISMVQTMLSKMKEMIEAWTPKLRQSTRKVKTINFWNWTSILEINEHFGWDFLSSIYDQLLLSRPTSMAVA